MSRRFQFSLKWLLVAISAIGPAVPVGRWFLGLDWFVASLLALACAIVVIIGGSQAALLRLVSRFDSGQDE
jgi:hypothetical protein